MKLLEDHIRFVVSWVRYDHYNDLLAAMHYIFWFFSQGGVLVLCFCLPPPFRHTLPYIIATLIALWSLILDLRVGVFMCLWETMLVGVSRHTWEAFSYHPRLPIYAVGAIVIALWIEVRAHVLIQRKVPNGPPGFSRTVMYRVGLPYLLLFMGVFYMTLHLSLKHLGYMPWLERYAENQCQEWQRME